MAFNVQVSGQKNVTSQRAYYTAANVTSGTFSGGEVVCVDPSPSTNADGLSVRQHENTVTTRAAGVVVGWQDADASVAQWVDIVPFGQSNMGLFNVIASANDIAANAALHLLDDSFQVDDATATGALALPISSYEASTAVGQKIKALDQV